MTQSSNSRSQEDPGSKLDATTILSVSIVSKTFSKKGPNVLKDISFTQERGEVLSILGPSGSGKTTLLRAISGLDSEYCGEIRFVANREVEQAGPSVVFQDARLFPWWNVEKNVSYSLQKNMKRSDRQTAVDRTLSLVGLGSHKHAWPKQLSGGMEKRAALARALVSSPQLLLLDEPFGALDSLTRMQLQSELISLRKKLGLSILLVTHDIEEAIFLSDRIIILSGQPTTIQKQFSIDIEHPRNRTSKEFDTLRRTVFDCVMSAQRA